MIHFIYTALLIIAVTCAMFLLHTHTRLNKLKPFAKQTFFGVIFGLVTIFANEVGTAVISNITINIRDASICTAGLVFGPWAGILAGLIGAVDRWFCVAWGGGEFTRVACSLACITTGVFTAVVKKIMFDDRRTTFLYGMIVALICESFHMLLVALTHANDATAAFEMIDKIAFPMISVNVLTVGLGLLALRLLTHTDLSGSAFKNEIAGAFLKGLFLNVLLAYFATMGISLATSRSTAVHQAIEQLKINVKYVVEDAQHYQTDNMTEMESAENVIDNWVIGTTGGFMIADGVGIVQNQQNVTLPQPISQIEQNTLQVIERNGESLYAMLEHADAGYYVIAYIPQAEVLNPTKYSLYVFSYVAIVIFAAMFLLIFIMLKRLVVNNINDVNYALNRIAEGKLDTKVNVRDFKEFKELSAGINKTVDALKVFIDKESERVAKELEFATKIQTSTLPNKFPAYPQNTSFDIYAKMDTAKEVGGDFYDFYFVGEDKFAILIADVSGKGVPAAMFMMNAKATIKSFAEAGLPANEVLKFANNLLCENNDADMFVTVWLGIVDLTTGEIQFANAGHNPPVILKNDNRAVFLQSKPGLVLAGMEGMAYRLNSTKLEPGETIYLYTDGITEANNREGELFGDEHLLECLEGKTTYDPKMLCLNVSHHVDIFENGVEPFDDKTMLAFKYFGE